MLPSEIIQQTERLPKGITIGIGRLKSLTYDIGEFKTDEEFYQFYIDITNFAKSTESQEEFNKLVVDRLILSNLLKITKISNTEA